MKKEVDFRLLPDVMRKAIVDAYEKDKIIYSGFIEVHKLKPQTFVYKNDGIIAMSEDFYKEIMSNKAIEIASKTIKDIFDKNNSQGER